MARVSVPPHVPVYRFHPTDEEIIRNYLKHKIYNQTFKCDAISVIDVYKSEPWDLPDKSKLKSRDLELYFFSVLDKKYANESNTNRSTEKGYWKISGKDQEIINGSGIIGMKKTLVYHKGGAPRGERTNWVMHEYRLVDDDLEKSGGNCGKDAYVLCKIFKKSESEDHVFDEENGCCVQEDERTEHLQFSDIFRTDTSQYNDVLYLETNDLRRSTQQDSFENVNFRTFLFEVEEYSQDELFQKV